MSYPTFWYPHFNRDHVLKPTGKEPVDKRWELWNDLSFDFHDYIKTYFFWLDARGNEYLINQISEAETKISWSTCLDFRKEARRMKCWDMSIAPSPSYTTTLAGAVERGWKPPPQVRLTPLFKKRGVN